MLGTNERHQDLQHSQVIFSLLIKRQSRTWELNLALRFGPKMLYLLSYWGIDIEKTLISEQKCNKISCYIICPYSATFLEVWPWFWVDLAFSRLPPLEDWPSQPLGGLEGQVSLLAACTRPGQPKSHRDIQKRLAVWANNVTQYHY